VKSYSSGMVMRFCFSVATSFDHDVLLLEEWLSAGDDAFVKQASERMLRRSRTVACRNNCHALARPG